MESARKPPPLVRLRQRYPTQYDAALFVFYLLLVYAWGLGIHPLGRDYAALSNPAEHLPFLAAELFEAEIQWFGASPEGYHVVNMLLLYLCMMCIYGIVRFTVKGPPWLGALAGLLFMANPVHSESVLNLSGITDLVPAFFALAALLQYTVHAHKRGAASYGLSLGIFALAVVPYNQNLPLIFVFLLYEAFVVETHKRSFLLLVPFAVVAISGAVHQSFSFDAAATNPVGMFVPLYFIFYPLGFLPETVRAFIDHPWQGWGAAVAVVLAVHFVAEKVDRGALWFGLYAMAAMRLFQGKDIVDPVHLVGGGRLLISNALFAVAMAAVFHRVMGHPKWRRQVILFTTLLCVIFFALEIRSVLAWREAGNLVRGWQETIEKTVRDEPLGLLPDYQYYRGAPILFSEALSYDTPFSKKTPHISLIKLHYEDPRNQQVILKSWTPIEAVLTVKQSPVLHAFPWPYTLADKNIDVFIDTTVLQVVDRDQDEITLTIRPALSELPKTTFPLSTSVTEDEP